MSQSVVLVSDVPGLGQLGDVRQVKDGYARNYLLPRRLALLATPNTLKRFEKQKEKISQKRDKQLAESKSISEKLSKVGLVFERTIGEGGRLYGSVTPHDIVSEIAKYGVTIEKKSVLITNPIKLIGDHTVRVRLHSQVSVDVPVKVIAKEVAKAPETAPTSEAETTEVASAS